MGSGSTLAQAPTPAVRPAQLSWPSSGHSQTKGEGQLGSLAPATGRQELGRGRKDQETQQPQEAPDALAPHVSQTPGAAASREQQRPEEQGRENLTAIHTVVSRVPGCGLCPSVVFQCLLGDPEGQLSALLEGPETRKPARGEKPCYRI